MLNAKLRFIADGLDGELNVVDSTNSIDFGLGFGAGVNFPIGKSSIFVEGCYVLGLTNAADEGKAPTGELGRSFEIVEGTDIKTRGIQLMAGITFPLGGY